MRRLACGVLLVATASACGGLVHPVNDDGNDITNPKSTNPGVGSLSLASDSSLIAVGSGAGIHVYYNQQPFPFNTAAITVVSSDSSVVVCCAIGMSVGTATLTYSYNGAHASIDISVYKNKAGASARMSALTSPTTGVSSWLPVSVTVPAGSIVEFALFPNQVEHNVVFDPIPGAPADVPTATVNGGFATIVSRTFATAGTYTFHCAAHGEAGSITVSP